MHNVDCITIRTFIILSLQNSLSKANPNYNFRPLNHYCLFIHLTSISKCSKKYFPDDFHHLLLSTATTNYKQSLNNWSFFDENLQRKRMYAIHLQYILHLPHSMLLTQRTLFILFQSIDAVTLCFTRLFWWRKNISVK